MLGDIDAAALEKCAAGIGAPDMVLAVVTDVSRRNRLTRLSQRRCERFGHIDIMVNNAGIAPVQTSSTSARPTTTGFSMST